MLDLFFKRFNIQLSTLGERHENFNNDSNSNTILGLCSFMPLGYGQVSRSNIMERHLDPDAYLDDMERLEQKEQEAQHKLDQQEKHDE
jgi:hypothetical protein